MGYVLVKAPATGTEQVPFGIPTPPPNASQAAVSGGAVQVMVDPNYPAGAQFFGQSPTVGSDPSGDPNAALGYTAPSHFRYTDPNTGKTSTELNPLAGSTIMNPEAGRQIHSRAQTAGMKGAKALGLTLGAYSALMGFADDSDQDVVSAAMNAGLNGYSTYAQFAQLAQHFDRQGRSQLANKLRDHANKQATQAFLSEQVAGRQIGASPPYAPSTHSNRAKIFGEGGNLNVSSIRRPPFQGPAPPPSGTLPTLDPATKPPSGDLPTLEPATKPATEPDLGAFESDVSLGEPEEKKVAVKRKKEERKKEEEEEDGGTRQTTLSEGWRGGYVDS